MKIPAVQPAVSQWSRRYASKLFAGAAIGMASSAIRSRHAAAAEQPVYYTWEGYDDPEFFSGYVGDSGGLPIIQTFIDEDEALARLKEGLPADVVHPCADTLPHWRRAGVVVPIDTSRLSNWQSLFEPLKSIPSITADDQQWLVPLDWGTTSIVYRADLVDFAEESYNLLWDERYAGKLALGEDATESVIMAALATGISDPFNMSDVELSQLKRRLVEQRALLRYYWTDPATIQDDLRTGALVASSGWSDTYLTLKKEGIPVKYMRPKEGILSWCCGLALTASGSALDQSYELIDALIGPEGGRWLTSQGIAHSNRSTYELLGTAATEEIGLPSDPAELLETSVFLRESARILEYQRMFDEVRSEG